MTIFQGQKAVFATFSSFKIVWESFSAQKNFSCILGPKGCLTALIKIVVQVLTLVVEVNFDNSHAQKSHFLYFLEIISCLDIVFLLEWPTIG